MVKLLKEDKDYSTVGLFLSNEYSIGDLDSALWSGAKDRWSSYSDAQKAYLIDLFSSYAYDADEFPTITQFNDFIWFDSEEFLANEELDESIWGNYSDYDPKDGWTEEDVELHKSIDWTGRNYEEYPVEEDSFMHNAVLYGVQGGPIRKEVKFIKYIRSNPIYPPYYGPVDRTPFDVDVDYVGPMYDGFKHGRYDIHDRFETQETYDLLSR